MSGSFQALLSTTLLNNTVCIAYSSLVYVVSNVKAVLPMILISLLLRISLNPLSSFLFNIMLQNIVYVFLLLDFTDMFAKFHESLLFPIQILMTSLSF